jgi:hypothetical protein
MSSCVFVATAVSQEIHDRLSRDLNLLEPHVVLSPFGIYTFRFAISLSSSSRINLHRAIWVGELS